jgi:hypothetical protein
MELTQRELDEIGAAITESGAGSGPAGQRG